MSLFTNARWVGVSQGSKVVCQITSMIVLAKLLHPADYGVMALAMVVASFAFIFRDLGTGAAIIHKRDLPDSQISTIFWFNIAIGIVIAIVLAIFSRYVLHFYKAPQLPNLLLLISLVFPITSASVAHQALMERRSQFKSIAIMETINQFIGLSVAIIFALSGAGVYSLVVPLILSSVLSSIWLWLNSGWKPAWHWSAAEFKEVMGFSGNLSLFNFVEYFSTNSDAMIIGRYLGTAALGSYYLAYKIMLFPIQNLTWVVNRILLPKLCELRDNKQAAKALYFKSLHLILTITAPLMVGIWVLRVPFIDSVFGHKWSLVSMLLAWLAPVGLIQSAVHTTGVVFTAYGRTRLLLKLGVFSMGINAAAFFVGAQLGVEQFVMFYLLANIINLAVCGSYLLKILDASLTEIAETFKWPFICSAIMGLSLMIVRNALVNSLPTILQLVIGVLVGIFTYALLINSVSKTSMDPVLRLIKLK